MENPVAMIEASLVLYFLSLYISFCNQHSTAVLPMKEATASTAERPGSSRLPASGAEELAGKVNKTIIHKTGQKDERRLE